MNKLRGPEEMVSLLRVHFRSSCGALKINLWDPTREIGLKVAQFILMYNQG